MSLRATLNLAIGVILVTALSLAGTLLLDRRLSQATSQSASISVSTIRVGTQFPGTVTAVLVVDGDHVEAGQPLLAVSSLTLQRDLREGSIAAENEAFRVAPDGTVTYLAAADGVVAGLTARTGAFVPAGTEVATILEAGTLYAVAHYDLGPREYARVEVGAPVSLSLPNTVTVPGEVAAVTVRTESGRAQAEVTISSPDLASHEIEGFFTPGTPIEARMKLSDAGPLANVRHAVADFGKKIGL